MPRIVSKVIDACVFRRTPAGAEFLLLRRRPSSRIGGTWQFVHGKVEPGETAFAAALREIREETGLTPLRFWQLEFVNTFYSAAEDQIEMCPGFAAEAAGDAAVKLCPEHTEFRWAMLEDALQTVLWPGQREILREIQREFVQGGPAERFLRIPLSDFPS